MSRAALSISPLLVGFALAIAAGAQPLQQEQAGTAFTGELTAVDASAGTISARGANGEQGIFEIDENATTIMSGSQKVGLQGLHVGEWVAIDAEQRGSRKVATYVEVVDDPDSMPAGASSPTLATAAGATIEVGHGRLEPALVQIGAGQSVTFHNVDKMPGGHTVMAPDGSFSSPPLDEDDSWSHSFDVPGVYPVQIKEHPAAKASIVVE